MRFSKAEACCLLPYLNKQFKYAGSLCVIIAFPKLVRYTYFSSLLPLAFCLLPKTHNFCTSAD
jgi:hypothetical protein